jgi:hypothetical protein
MSLSVVKIATVRVETPPVRPRGTVIATHRTRALLSLLLAAGLTGAFGVAPARAETSPTGAQYHKIRFPVRGTVSYYDDFGNCRDGCTRSHQGNDLMGAKLMPLVAAADATVTSVRVDDGTSKAGNMLVLKEASGWFYYYIHINNDTPGTDDGKNPAAWRFAPGIAVGTKVKAGQFIAYMGDSGNAEGTAPHLHFEMHRPDGEAISPFVSLQLAQGKPAGGLCRFPSNPKPNPSTAGGRGYWTVGSDGAVRTYGSAKFYGATKGTGVTRPVVDMATTPTGNGYWLADAAGQVYPFGDAKGYGGTEKLALHAPVIGIWPTGTGKGYWLLASDGGMFSFGDARFYGSMGNKKLNAPIIGMAGTPTGKGYWLLGRDGGVFSFGDARFYGSTGNMTLDRPVISMAATKTGQGYWLLGADGGMFSFGDARYRGSLPGSGLCTFPDARAITPTETGNGYWILQVDGAITTYGDAVYYGDPKSRGTRALSIEVLPIP